MLYLIGAGLNNEFDFSLRAIDILKKCDEVYFEAYTSLNRIDFNNFEKLINKKVVKVDRFFVENNSDNLLDNAKTKDIALIVIGHPLIATTHSMFLLDHNYNSNVRVIHNYSILNAISVTGLELYKFGRIVSIPYHQSSSYIDYIKQNLNIGLHTLALLDLKADQDKYMNINEALSRLSLFSDKLFVACCALATDDEQIFFGSYSGLNSIDFSNKPKPQCLIIPGNMHFIEKDILNQYAIRTNDQ